MRGRSKRTTRREVKRIDNKRARSANEQALGGGHVRNVHSASWGHRLDAPTMLDEASTHLKPKKAKKKRKPKDRCSKNPKNHRHEYMKDMREVKDYRLRYDFKSDTFRSEPYTYTEQYKLCVWCGKELVRKKIQWRYGPAWSRWRPAH